MKDMEKSITLIGLPGCGKTTVGNLLSDKLNYEFIDMDFYIEKKQGKTIIVVSSEMPEILGITNRIGVMSNGRLAGIVNTKDTNQEELLRLSAKYL